MWSFNVHTFCSGRTFWLLAAEAQEHRRATDRIACVSFYWRLECLIFCYSYLRRVGPNTNIPVGMAIFYINDSTFPTLSKQS